MSFQPIIPVPDSRQGITGCLDQCIHRACVSRGLVVSTQVDFTNYTGPVYYRAQMSYIGCAAPAYDIEFMVLL